MFISYIRQVWPDNVLMSSTIDKICKHQRRLTIHLNMAHYMLPYLCKLNNLNSSANYYTNCQRFKELISKGAIIFKNWSQYDTSIMVLEVSAAVSLASSPFSNVESAMSSNGWYLVLSFFFTESEADAWILFFKTLLLLMQGLPFTLRNLFLQVVNLHIHNFLSYNLKLLIRVQEE